MWGMRLSYFFPLLFVLITKKNHENQTLRKGIAIICILAVITEIGGEVSTNLLGSGTPAVNLYEIAFTLTTLLIYWNLFKRPYEKRRLVWSILLFFILGISSLFYFGLFRTNIFTGIFGQLLLMLVSVSYLYRLFQEASVPDLKSYLPFWFSAGMLIYTAVTFFLILFESNLRNENGSIFSSLWQIQLYVSILFNLILAKGIWETRLRSS